MTAGYLTNTIKQIMPSGKYSGEKLIDLPESYLIWFHQKGFPTEKLGEQLALMYAIKANGLKETLQPFRSR